MRFEPNKLILGCANLGGLFLDGAKPDAERAAAIVSEAMRLGISKFDTAPLYGWGASEFFLGRALEMVKADRSSIYVSSKSLRALLPCIAERDATQPDFWTLGEPNCRFTHAWKVDYDSVMQTTLRSLEAIRSSYLNGLSFHDIADAFQEDPSLTWEQLDTAIQACKDLKASGFVREIGFGGKESKTLSTLLERHPGLLTYASTTTYTLIDQEFFTEGGFDLCQKHNIEYRVSGPFCSRLLAQDPRKASSTTGKDGVVRWYYNGNVDMPVTFNYRYITEQQYSKACKLWSVCEKFGESTPRAAALQFVLSCDDVASVIIGASQPEHLSDIKESIERVINPRLWDALAKEGIVEKGTLPF